jgi:iron complex outermembrane receptor protein
MTFNDGDIDEYEDERIVATGSFPDSDCQTVNVGVVVDNCKVDRSDENLPRLPEQIYFAAVQYDWETDFGTITPLIQYSLRTNREGCFDRASCLSGVYLVDHEDLGARLTWLPPETKWRVTAYGSNLTDERYIVGGTPLVDVTAEAGGRCRTESIDPGPPWQPGG